MLALTPRITVSVTATNAHWYWGDVLMTQILYVASPLVIWFHKMIILGAVMRETTSNVSHIYMVIAFIENIVHLRPFKNILYFMYKIKLGSDHCKQGFHLQMTLSTCPWHETALCFHHWTFLVTGPG